MSLPLRLTYQNNDVTFYILNEKPSYSSRILDILLNGKTYQLSKANGKWQTNEQADVNDSDLLLNVAKSIGLRYRI